MPITPHTTHPGITTLRLQSIRHHVAATEVNKNIDFPPPNPFPTLFIIFILFIYCNHLGKLPTLPSVPKN